jgi:hypothetical protein
VPDDLTPADPVGAIGTALRACGYDTVDVDLDGNPVVVGRRSDVRLRWMAARLHTFVLAARFPAPEDAGVLDRYLDLACRYAVDHKGGLPRGLQAGTAAVAVAVVDRGSEVTTSWADHPHGRRFAAMAYPVVVELDTGRVVHPGRMLLGAVFSGHLQRVADDVVGPALRV